MSDNEYITVEDDEGNEKVFQVDAMFDMEDHSYAMITSGDETLVMRVEGKEGKQSLVSATEDEIENLMDAYNLAIDATIEEEDGDDGGHPIH
ncbi:DUF1292 domain-containing protein [Evansella sp. AB-P1]|uniref:DUF1292 domain-containing protein n=1 Tax=Evansella sp. AB-P1 TaxID=3037653 RepID=UPI00241E3E9A|nr:DUF1292 domain-containing protein [Evansella sp. AB-P1]MDG5786730.1 DUF1292 domain-containing protein [Evansella sp. AB-P1]